MDPESSWIIRGHFPCQSLRPISFRGGEPSVIPSLALIMGSAPMCGLFNVTKATLEEKYLRLAWEPVS